MFLFQMPLISTSPTSQHPPSHSLLSQLGGIVNPPDRFCHLEFDSTTGDYMYNYDTRQDYPSTAFIADILNERRIIPIFAIPPLKQSTYFNLRDTIRSAFIGNLADDEDDLLSEIERQYRVGCNETPSHGHQWLARLFPLT